MKHRLPVVTATVVAFAFVFVSFAANSLRAAEVAGKEAPVAMQPYVVKESPFGYLGIKHATLRLSVFRLITFRGAIRDLVVDEMYPDSPGVAAGIRHGDRIVGIDGVPISAWTFGKMKAFAERVEVGQRVPVDVVRPPGTEVLHFVVVTARKPAASSGT